MVVGGRGQRAGEMGEGGQKAQTSGHKMSKSWELKTPRRKTKVVAPLMDRMVIIAINTVSTYIQKLLRETLKVLITRIKQLATV